MYTVSTLEKSDTKKSNCHHTVVIKIGGSTLSSQAALAEILNDIGGIVAAGTNVVLVHGGGPAISEAIQKEGSACHFVEGLRVTDEKVLSIAKDVLDDLNHQIVDHLNKRGIKSCSIDSSVPGILTAQKKLLSLKSGTQLDIGYVGEISGVNAEALQSLLDAHIVPVFVSMACDSSDQLYNVNADNVAMALAVAISADKLVYVTDVPGIMLDQEMVLREIDLDQIGVLVDSGIIKGGMIPKVRSCAAGIRKGIGSVVIGKVEGPGSLLSAIFTPECYGTVISKTRLIA